MSLRSKISATLRRLDKAYIPFDFLLCPSLLRQFEDRTGSNDYREYYAFPIRDVAAGYIGDLDKFRVYYPDATSIRIDPDWGVGRTPGAFAHFTKMRHPMQNFQTLAEYEAYPHPHPQQDYDWETCQATVQALQARDLVVAGGGEMGMFETAWYLRGMQNFLVDMLLNPDLANYLLERITQVQCVLAERYARAGVDILKVGDDIATQRGMMMKTTLWREFLKPRMARLIQAAKSIRPDILVFYHSDGNMQAVIPELIEIGVDILNPVQPECMDPVAIKREFGGELSFWGTIGTQTTMPFGSPEEVAAVCRRMIDEVGRGGGLGLAPTHMLEPEVPWENIQAMMDTVQEHNAKM